MRNKLATFIQKIKKFNPQYLKQSIIIINDGWFIRALFNTVFTITSPAAPLYIYWKYYEDINLDTVNKVLEEEKGKISMYITLNFNIIYNIVMNQNPFNTKGRLTHFIKQNIERSSFQIQKKLVSTYWIICI